MTLPLYGNPGSGVGRPNRGHTGLWFSRFFDRFDERQDWKVPKEEKRKWIQDTEGPCGDQEALGRACLRQLDLSRTLGGQSRAFTTRWHFATGLGLPHPVENGFTWHPTLGVPYLCGAAVKGLINAWVEMDEELSAMARKARQKEWFGDQNCAGQLVFLDALPVVSPMLSCDVMTPHMGDWYLKGGSISDPAREPEKVPADWHDPVPVPFLVVRQATFLFSVAPRGAEFADRVDPAVAALESALRDLGAGAKTAGGYGHMRKDDEALGRLTAKIEKIDQEQAEEEELNAMSPLDRSMKEAIAASNVPPHVALLQALERGHWSAAEARQVARRIRDIMQAERKWRPTSKKAKRDKDHRRTLQVIALLGDDV